MLYIFDLYQLYHQLLQPRASPGTAVSLAKTLSDQVYKLLQCNFILFYVIVQRVKVSVAILTDLNLLPYQTAIIP